MIKYKEALKKAAFITMGSLMSISGIASDDNKEKDWGVINVSVCNMRVEGEYSAGMATQGLLGMPVRIVKDDGWLQVETPEGYVSWVHPRSVHRMTRDQLTDWNTAPQLVVTAPLTIIYSQPKRTSQIVGDAVACNRLRYLGGRSTYHKVACPDGRIGYISKHDAEEIGKWRKSLKNTVPELTKTAMTMLGFPYMWGGMSTKGIDCSGFVRTFLLMHDIIIPRDASQMAYKGLHIDITPDFSNLEPGDLLFFGSKATDTEKAKVSHVAFYLGDRKFIHSLGMVQIGSFDPNAPDYNEYDLNRLLWAQRVLPYIDREQGLFTTPNSDFYK